MMIKLEHIKKYYNRNKINQFLVCNDMTIEFDSVGLVCILGSSGSGKTTLLNIISGIDNFEKGKIEFDGEVITKYRQNQWDDIRKHKIGYVYQNYHLLKNMTVYQNIEPILKMQGITDETEVRDRVLRLLEAVGLANYADRLVKQLSGGQQQRVAFARALANNPKVILADEPTGNLDSKNTIELMNLIKETSKTRLVIMVTHEQSLADFYADRIVEIENGTIIRDCLNETHNNLDYIQEHIINLKNFNKTNTKDKNININRFSDKEKPDNLDIDLIERNQTLYVKINSKSLKRTKYLDVDSEVQIVDELESQSEQSNPFVLDDFYDKDKYENAKKVFTWKDSFKYAFRNLNIFRHKNKILLFVMLLVGIIISVSVGLLGEVYYVEEPYRTVDSNYITVYMDRTQYDEYALLEDIPNVDQLMLVNEPFYFLLSTPAYYEVRGTTRVSAQPIDIKFFDTETLIFGEVPGQYEIVIDKSVADDIIKNNVQRGIQTYDDVLNCKFRMLTNGVDTSVAEDSALYFSISGIANGNSRSVWMEEELIYSLVTPTLTDYRLLGDNFNIISGRLPTSSTKIMLNENYTSVLLGSVPYNVGISTGNYYISGIYAYVVDGESYDFQKAMISELGYIKEKYFYYRYHRFQDFKLLVYAKDVKAALDSLEEAGYTASANIYTASTAQYFKLKENQTFYLLGLGGIVISAFSILLVMRSSLISRTYEISVYRNIGISRKEIRRIFFLEILLTTTFSTVLGFLIMVLLLIQAQSTLHVVSVTHFTLPVVLFVIIGMYLINIVFGLIPINQLINKTPAYIMKKNDL